MERGRARGFEEALEFASSELRRYATPENGTVLLGTKAAQMDRADSQGTS
jgi:hypothetical protein